MQYIVIHINIALTFPVQVIFIVLYTDYLTLNMKLYPYNNTNVIHECKGVCSESVGSTYIRFANISSTYILHITTLLHSLFDAQVFWYIAIFNNSLSSSWQRNILILPSLT